MGDNSGNVIVQKRLQKRAPSIAAASIMALGIACRPARKKQKIIADPAPC
jgi:hypothetical protein